MPSVASQVAASIAQHRDAKVSSAATNSERSPSSPFAEMLDSNAAPDRPAPKADAPRSKATARNANASKSAKSDNGKSSVRDTPSRDKATAASDSKVKADDDISATATKAVAASDTQPAEVEAPVDQQTADEIAALLAAVTTPANPDQAPVAAKTTNENPTPVDPVAESVARPAPTADPVPASTAIAAAIAPDAGIASETAVTPATIAAATTVTQAADRADKLAATKNDTQAAGDEPAADAKLAADVPLDAKAAPKAETAKAPAEAKPHHDTQQHTETADGPAAEQAPAPAQNPAHATANRPAASVEAKAGARPEVPAQTDAVAALKPADMTPSVPQTTPLTNAPASLAVHQVSTSDATPGATAPVPIDGVAVEIASKAFEGKNRFDIRLDPPELGRIHVRLEVDRNGEITSRVMADRQDTLDLLRRDAPQLERALSDAGLRTADNGLQFSLRDQSQSRDQQSNATDNARLIVSDDSLVSEATQRGYYRPAGSPGGLDIRV